MAPLGELRFGDPLRADVEAGERHLARALARKELAEQLPFEVVDVIAERVRDVLRADVGDEQALLALARRLTRCAVEPDGARIVAGLPKLGNSPAVRVPLG